MKLLIIDDERRIADSIKKGMEQEHFTVDATHEADILPDTDRLNQAVTNGKLTEDQMNLILKKHEEMQKWAEVQGIDMQYLMGPNGGQCTRGMHGFRNK